MKLTRKPTGLTRNEAALFYSSRVVLISRELAYLTNLWTPCTVKANNKVGGLGIESVGVTCLKANLTPCKGCQKNKEVYKEKRRLKSQFSKAINDLCANRPVEGILCEKSEPSFTDLYESKFNEVSE